MKIYVIHPDHDYAVQSVWSSLEKAQQAMKDLEEFDRKRWALLQNPAHPYDYPGFRYYFDELDLDDLNLPDLPTVIRGK